MIIDFSQKFDGVINLITAIALIYYAAFMSNAEKNGGLKKRLLFLLSTLAVLCLARGTNYFMKFGSTFEVFILIISSLVPFALFLLVELMLRRHLPLPMKLFSSLSTILLIIGFLIFGINKITLFALMAVYVLTLISIFVALGTKDDFELQKSELSLIRINMVIMILIIPLIVTDFKIIFGWQTIRLGSFGILFFLYALVKIWGNFNLQQGFYRLTNLLIFNLASAALISWLFNIQNLYFHIFVIFVMLRMFSEILIYLSDSYSKNAQAMIYLVINAFVKSDLNIKSCKKEIPEDIFFLLTKSDLAFYRTERIINSFKDGALQFKDEINKLEFDNDTLEEMKHIYEDFDSNACIFLKIPNDDFFMIFFKWPSMAPKNKLEKEISFLQTLALKIKE